ncbi:HAD family hydrolase [Rhizobium halophytocola]|uniref:Phosphoglycolate phosphatase n=1 Tax=Rhizobium halophytocola TaxID=735519 RepID=A0ABS4DXM5_9HYPH|nr:HAD family hydrolase [Rhizobium halophytocola]MBP1850443.1 phosphoglycolate phosphatase [Rhizobium halophytocola]
MTFSAIKGILFDKDGTLLDFDKSWEVVNREVTLMAASGDQAIADRYLDRCGMDPVTGHIRADSLFASGNTRELAESLIADGAGHGLEDLVERIDIAFAAAADHSVAITELADLFAALKDQGFALGIASSDNERSIRRTVERFALTPYVDFVAGYDSGHGVKPTAGMVLGFCAATGLRPAQVAVVGDNNHDLHMGLNAGAGLKIGVLSGTGSRESLQADSDMLIPDISHLPGLLGASTPA